MENKVAADSTGTPDDIQQIAALAMILELDQADIRAGNFRDVDAFFAELDAEYPTN
ncbi:hypothetical protein M3I53_05455 [Paraburkholderia sp. CNPSo 3272]|uniref:hypothetical protein n=1 Tax=Paraburkholderia sp. CNPSo 3272 TaxID=2940931 RepID=UPI0020B63E47|nr:hypothetical protein [Paraburkholderia sp. CNPSo 3272]MCP3722584.1 hypothetical protein [Paraburkholderia sp. CNPSo 3272]